MTFPMFSLLCNHIIILHVQLYYCTARAVISLYHTCIHNITCAYITHVHSHILLNVQSHYYTARAVISIFHTCSHITVSHVQLYHCFTRAVIFLYRDVISLTFLVTLTLIRITEHVTPGLTRHLVTPDL